MHRFVADDIVELELAVLNMAGWVPATEVFRRSRERSMTSVITPASPIDSHKGGQSCQCRDIEQDHRPEKAYRRTGELARGPCS
jgi:hypothetical protein